MKNTTLIVLLAFNLALAVSAADEEQVVAPGRKPITLPEGVHVERDLAFLPPDRKEKLDLYRPTNAAPGAKLPCVIVIHGGGFNDGDKARQREASIAADLVRGGYTAASINYKLWSKGVRRPTWPQSLIDAKSAVAWLRINADKLGIDADRIGVLGSSAGGNLSAMLALTQPKDGFEPEGEFAGVSTAVKCAVDLYGAVDLPNYHDMKMFLKTREEAVEEYKKASPVKYAHKDAPPVLIIHGDADTVVNVKQSETLAAVLKSAGANPELVILPGAPHSFDLQPPQRDIRPLVLGFFEKHLGPGKPSLRQADSTP